MAVGAALAPVAEGAGAAAGAGEVAAGAEGGGGLMSGRGLGGRGGGRGRRKRTAAAPEPDDTHNNDAPTFLERLWQAEASADLFERVQKIAGSLPTYTEGAVVNVFGGKGSSLAGLYYLALSAAWGAVSPSPLFGAPIMVRTYVNRTARHVMAQVSYSVKTTLVDLVKPSAGFLTTAEGSAVLNYTKIFFPPPETVTGDTWNPKLAVAGAAVNTISQMTGAADLMHTPLNVLQAARLGDFEGRTITTPSDDFDKLKQSKFGKDYFELNPSPVMDGLTRDSDLTAVITQALWDPELENPPAPNTNYRYKVRTTINSQYQQPITAAPSGLVNGSVVSGADLDLPQQVLDQIDDDQTNQNYKGRPTDPPNKTQ